jgi:hypothetical protein
MVLAIRSAVFPVPGALGVQEGGYVIVGNLLGIPGDAAFALSLIARVRELILGIPGLLAWQLIEARRVLRARSVASARKNSRLAIASRRLQPRTHVAQKKGRGVAPGVTGRCRFRM